MVWGFKFTAADLTAKQKVSQDNINELKKFLEDLDEKNVPKSLPDEFIATILIACLNDVAVSKKTIISHFNAKKLAPSLFDNRNVDNEDLQLALKTTCFASIPWAEDNSEVIYVKLRDTNYRNCYMEPQLKISNMIIDAIHVTHPPDNIVIVQDMEGMGLMHITRVKLDSLRTFFSYIQEGLPVNLKSVHYVNSNYVLNKFMVIAKLFIKPELYYKIHFHRGTEGLADHIPKRYIPSEFNGENSSMEDQHIGLVAKLKELQTYFTEEENLRNKSL